MAKSSMIISEDAESVAEETAAKEDTEAVSEEAVEAGEAEPVEEAEAEASAEVESEEKAEEATLTKDEAAFAEEAESAAEETAAEGTTAEETTAKEDTEAVSEEAVEAGEAEPVEEAEAEASAEVESEEKAEEATLAAEEAAFAEEAESAAEETAAKEDAEAVSKEAVEAEEKGNAEAGAKPVTIDETDESKEQPVSDTIRKMTQSPAVLQGEPASSTTAESATVGGTREFLAMCAKDIMQKEVIWGSPDDSVQQTLTKMQQHDVGYMVVGRDGVMEGIVSKSDLTGAISPYLRPVFAKWRRPLDDATLQIKIKWIMSRPVRTVKPETSLAVIMEDMRRFGGHCLAVVDEEGKVQGLVTIFDIFSGILLKQYDGLSSNSNISSVGKTPQAPPLV